MKLFDIFTKTSSSDTPLIITRKAWIDKKTGNMSAIHISNGQLYSDSSYEYKAELSVTDLISDDWQFRKNIWIDT